MFRNERYTVSINGMRKMIQKSSVLMTVNIKDPFITPTFLIMILFRSH